MTDNDHLCNYARKCIEKVRAPEPARTPAWINEIPDRIGTLLIERHMCKNGEVWGLAKSNPSQDMPYDEVGSERFIEYAYEYNLFDMIGGWSEMAKQETIRFWQSWQNPKTGRFVDPRDPERVVNEKYIVGLLSTLGTEPVYPHTSTSNTGEIDTTIFLQRTKEDPDWQAGGWGVGSHTGFMAKEILKAINSQGREDLIPDLERGIEQILSHQDPVSGLWGPTDARLGGRIGGTLKVIGRLYFQMGMLVPYARELTDALIRHEDKGEWFACSVNICIPRNVAEMLGFCLETADYRCEDLYKAMQAVVNDLRAWMNPDGSSSDNRGEPGGISSCVMYACGLLAGYLHWDDCRLANPLVCTPMTRGARFRLRPVLLPDGKVAVREMS